MDKWLLKRPRAKHGDGDEVDTGKCSRSQTSTKTIEPKPGTSSTPDVLVEPVIDFVDYDDPDDPAPIVDYDDPDDPAPIVDYDDPDDPAPISELELVEPRPTTGVKKKPKIGKYPYKASEPQFVQGWLKLPIFANWLEKNKKKKGGHDMAYCRICDADLTAHKTELVRHAKSTKHLKRSQEIASNKEFTKLVPDVKVEDSIKRAEIKLAALVAENNLPFTVMDKLTPLIKDICPDSKIAEKLALRRTKTTTIIKQTLGSTFLELLYDKLREPGSFFSIIMDETTDVGTKKQCALSVVYFDKLTGSVKTQFFDMYETVSSTAEDLLNSMVNSILKKKIPIENLVGFSADTTNSKVGQHHSVFSFLKERYPQVVCVKCSCHMAHLAASKACMKLPKEIEDLLRNLASHFNRSFPRQEALKEFQIFFTTDIHKILSPSITRWLSLKQCVDRVIEQFEPLKAYLNLMLFEDPSPTVQSMAECMNNKFTIVYLEFLAYVLGIVTDFNLLFQSEIPLLHTLKPQVEKMLLDLCSNYMNTQYIWSQPNIIAAEHSNPRHFLKLNDIYLGIAAHESFNKLKSSPDITEIQRESFLINCMNFYIELVSQIKSRFNFSDSVFDCLKILEPKTAQTFKTLKIESLVHVFQRFPILKNFVDPQKVDSEWKLHVLKWKEIFKDQDEEKQNVTHEEHADKYWSKIFKVKNEGGQHLFANLQKVIELLLVLPFSNAPRVERVFSNLNRCKTNDRNKLKTETVVALMGAKQGVESAGGCVRFEPSKEMLRKNIWKKN
jgi:hypothetical protein